MHEVQQAPLRPGKPMQFSVLRVPFFLEPDYDPSPEFEETNRVRLMRKWGGPQGWEAQKRSHRLKERGQEVGIERFDLDRIASNTLASHRLVQWVTKTKGLTAAERLYNDLNYQHFELGRKLNDWQMLATAAEEHAGVPAEESLAFLETHQGVAEIQKAQGLLRQLGVNGIPTFVLGATTVLPSGALRAQYLVKAFRDLEEAS
eukprot:CAMPEP_0119090170 /NCGR_PEP_ID=MMETSP1178-20130426/151615_1 /TAXON_ID=33656 /ORGANISM="unid sp, Strain CCMP2000" /LENGTH=202 /DNA_ID=CAMNT_0007073567 /DNA_START=157 /DNA_END=761 /DNA_ORIENTATION=+